LVPRLALSPTDVRERSRTGFSVLNTKKCYGNLDWYHGHVSKEEENKLTGPGPIVPSLDEMTMVHSPLHYKHH